MIEVYLGHNNTAELRLTRRGQAVDLSLVTRISLVVDGVPIADSLESPGVFNWVEKVGVVIVSLGNSGLPRFRRYENVRLLTYDPDNPDGVVWTDRLAFSIK